VSQTAGLQAKNLELLSDGISFTAVYNGEETRVELPIPGKFTVYNALTVLGIGVQLGVSLADCAQALKVCVYFCLSWHGVSPRP
jgi:UDP-N-acetylmuramoyl-L-alanyl-D-glutamate--2,6-diaminopimelate ligase